MDSPRRLVDTQPDWKPALSNEAGRRRIPGGMGRVRASPKPTARLDREGNEMDIRSVQKPLKEQYRDTPAAARIRLEAHGSQGDTPMACSIQVAQQVREAEAHLGVGGPGLGACSGDLLLGALAACSQITAQMVATAMGVPVEGIKVTVGGELDLRGTLGVSREVPVGFESIDVHFEIDAPDATPEEMEALQARTERYCVVMQTLLQSPQIETIWTV